MHTLSQEQYNAQVDAILRAVRDPASYAAYKTPIDEVDPLILECEQIDQACAGLSKADEQQVWKAYNTAGYAAALGTAIGLKAARTAAAQVKASAPPAVKVKQAPGMTSIEVPTDMAAEITAWRAAQGDQAFTKMLRQARGGQATMGAKLADDEKAATMKSDNGKLLFRAVRDKRGKLLP